MSAISRERRGRGPSAGVPSILLNAALLTLALAPAPPAAAQEREERRVDDCRCVDREGKEIEDCVCLAPSRLARTLIASRAWAPVQARARIGIGVSTDQGSDRDARGVRVQDVLEDGPADEAGLREGDLIVRIGGRSVFEPLADREREEQIDLDRSVPVQRFLAMVGEVEPGTDVEIEYVRDGETRTAVVLPEEAPGSFRVFSLPRGGGALPFDRDAREWTEMRNRLRSLSEEGASRFYLRSPGDEGASVYLHAPDREGGASVLLRTPGDEGAVRLRSLAGDPCFGAGGRVTFFGDGCVDGVEMRALNPDLGAYFSASEGVLVVEAREGSTLGLRAGDVILAVGGRDVEAPGDVSRILRSYETDEVVTFRVIRKAEAMEVSGRRR